MRERGRPSYLGAACGDTIGLTDSRALIFSQGFHRRDQHDERDPTKTPEISHHVRHSNPPDRQGLRDATQLRLFLLLPSFLRWDAWHRIDEARIAAELRLRQRK